MAQVNYSIIGGTLQEVPIHKQGERGGTKSTARGVLVHTYTTKAGDNWVDHHVAIPYCAEGFPADNLGQYGKAGDAVIMQGVWRLMGETLTLMVDKIVKPDRPAFKPKDKPAASSREDLM